MTGQGNEGPEGELVLPEQPSAGHATARTDSRVSVAGRARAVCSWFSTRPLLLVGLVTAAAAQTWFVPGRFVASGDIAPFVRDGLVAELPWPWNSRVTGGGSLNYQIARLPEVLFLELSDRLGGSEMLAQRLFITSVFVSAALGAALLARALGATRWAIFAAGLVAAFNPYVLARLPNPLPLLAVGLAGALGSLLVRAARQNRPTTTTFALVSLGAAYLAFNPPLLALVGVWTVTVALLGNAWGGEGGARRAGSYLARTTPLVLGLNLWWAVPYVMTLLPGSGTELGVSRDVGTWAWTHRRSSLLNVLTLKAAWGWSEARYFPYAASMDRLPFGALSLALPALALTAPIVARGRARRMALAMATSCALLVVLSKGLHGPAGNVNQWLYDHIPGFWLFRDPESKFGVLLVVLYAGLASITVTAATALARRTRRVGQAVRLGIAALVLAAVAYPYPLWTGDVVPDRRPGLPSAHVALPEAWRAAAAFVNQDDTSGKALVLPLGDFYQMPTTWGYYGSDAVPSNLLTRPVLAPHSASYLAGSDGLDGLINAVEDLLLTGSTADVVPLLRALGTSHVLLRNDFDRTFPGRSFADADVLRHALGRAPGLEKLAGFGVVDVYRLVDAKAAYATAPHLSVSSDLDRELPLLVARDAGRGVAVENPSTTRLASGPSTLVPSAGEDGIAFDVRHAGEYDVSHVSAEEAVYEARLVPGGALELSDPRRVTVGGQALPPNPTLRVSFGDDPVVAARVGTEVVDLRSPSSQEKPHMVSVGAATPVTVVAAAGGPSTLGPFGEIGDCHGTDDRAPAALGLRAEAISPEDGGGMRLRALAHSACVVAPIEPFDPAALYVLRLEQRTVGGRPARICVWQDGPDRCLPLPGPAARATTLETVLAPEPGTRALRLFLYADGPGDGRTETIVEYRQVAVVPVLPTWTGTISYKAPAAAPLRLPKGRVPVDITPSSGNLLEQFGAVGDCNRSDPRSLAQVGIRAERIRGGIRLRARAHRACVSAPIEGFPGVSTFDLRFEHRRLAGERPRICLWQQGPGRCAELPEPALTEKGQWATYRAHLRPERGTTGLRLFLYGDGAGGAETTVEYRNLSVRPVHPTTVVAVPKAPATTARIARERSPHPGRLDIEVEAVSDSFVLVVPESYAPGWALSGLPDGARAHHFRGNGYANAWLVEGARGNLSLVAEYAPARWPLRAIAGSALLLVGLAAKRLAAGLKRRPRSTRRVTLPRGPK